MSTSNTNQVRLTPTELSVMKLISQGLSRKEVAEKLVVSRRTVDFHMENIYDKLQVNNRMGAIEQSRKYGFLPSFCNESTP